MGRNLYGQRGRNSNEVPANFVALQVLQRIVMRNTPESKLGAAFGGKYFFRLSQCKRPNVKICANDFLLTHLKTKTDILKSPRAGWSCFCTQLPGLHQCRSQKNYLPLALRSPPHQFTNRLARRLPCMQNFPHLLRNRHLHSSRPR
jgi:hypothetical protein